MEDLDFRVYQRGVEIIQKHIVNDPGALRIWKECICSFVNNRSSRKGLSDEYKKEKFGEIIMQTLEIWLTEQGSKATLAALIKLLRNHALNNLCHVLEAKAKEIKHIQIKSASTPIIENDCIQNFWFGMTDVPNFVGRVEDLKSLHKLVTENRAEEHDSLALLTSVHGFGGIGKTTLARMYAWKYRDYFDGNVIWIDSEKFHSMRVALQRVAEELNLEVDMANFDLNLLTKSIYNAFSDSKCLFVFDNVEGMNGQNGVQQFLPSGIIRKPYLLLTSRRNDLFSTSRILRLDVLSQSDSIELVMMYIPGATNEIADKLAERLDRVPLAIHQAIAYIKKLLPLQSRSSKDDALKSINSFLKEYKNNSNKILKSNFIGVDGYTQNISSICEMSLRKMEIEEGGKLGKQMLRYISFLNPDDMELDFVLNLPYQYENIWNKLDRILPWTPETAMDPNMTLQLLCGYSLIDINTTEKTIKVHRLVQDAIRLMLTKNEELLYVQRLLAGLDEQVHTQRLSHWTSIKRSCRFGASISCFENVIPKGIIEFVGLLNSAGLNIDLSKKLVKLANRHSSGTLSLITPILKSMRCKDINESVKHYLETYFKIESALEERASRNLLLTNYIVFANFVFLEGQKSVLQSVFECLSILKITKCNRTLLLELLGTTFSSEDANIVLDIINRSSIVVMSGAEFKIDDLYDACLFDEDLQIPESLFNEFPCLNYLKSSSSFTNIDELQALNLSWDYKNSIIWSLFDNLEFNLESVRSAIAFICFIGCSIAEYIENYKTTIEGEEEYKKQEIMVQLVNAKLLRESKPGYYALLSLVCCLPSTFSVPYIFYGLEYDQLQLSWIYLWKLENLRFVTKKSEDTYFMNSDRQVALRRNVLSLEDKKEAIKRLHSACNYPCWTFRYYDEMTKCWRHLMNQKDLREIAMNCDLSLPIFNYSYLV